MTAVVAYRAVGLGAALIVGALVAQQLMTLLLAVTVTIILSLPLSAAASLAQRRGAPRALGALGALVAGLGAVIGLGLAVLPTFVSQVKQFTDRLPSILAQGDHYLHGLGMNSRGLSSQLRRIVQGYTNHPFRLAGPIERFSLTALGVAVPLVLIVLAAFLIAVNPAVLVDNFLRLLPAARHGRARDVLGRIRTAWLGWMTAVGIDMLVLGGLLFAGMQIIGLNFAIGFAVFSAFMTVIPNYGSVISAVPPILYAFAQSPGKALLVLIVYLVVNQIEGNLILPLIMARTVNLHPAVVTVGLLVMGALFGLVGVLIAIPLLSLTMILVQALWIEPQEARSGLPAKDRAAGTASTTMNL
ncbi:MAG: AI-2E family transporter [Solirubrobacteraceae bacterium]